MYGCDSLFVWWRGWSGGAYLLLLLLLQLGSVFFCTNAVIGSVSRECGSRAAERTADAVRSMLISPTQHSLLTCERSNAAITVQAAAACATARCCTTRRCGTQRCAANWCVASRCVASRWAANRCATCSQIYCAPTSYGSARLLTSTCSCTSPASHQTLSLLPDTPNAAQSELPLSSSMLHSRLELTYMFYTLNLIYNHIP